MYKVFTVFVGVPGNFDENCIKYFLYIFRFQLRRKMYIEDFTLVVISYEIYDHECKILFII